MKNKHQYRIKDDIRYSTDQNRYHAYSCIALTIDKVIHSCSQQKKRSAKQVNLKVRKGAGTNSEWKLKGELTTDGQKNALNQKNAVLKKGTRVTVQQVIKQGNDIWLKIPSGYIAGVYNQEVYVK